MQIHITQVAPEERGSAVALFATFLFLGQACGVWLAGRGVDAAGVTPGFLCAALGLAALAVQGAIGRQTVAEASKRSGIAAERPPPWLS